MLYNMGLIWIPELSGNKRVRKNKAGKGRLRPDTGAHLGLQANGIFLFAFLYGFSDWGILEGLFIETCCCTY